MCYGANLHLPDTCYARALGPNGIDEYTPVRGKKHPLVRSAPYLRRAKRAGGNIHVVG